MKIKDIELANISRYRGELMGMAMLFVILFHVGCPGTTPSSVFGAWGISVSTCFSS